MSCQGTGAGEGAPQQPPDDGSRTLHQITARTDPLLQRSISAPRSRAPPRSIDHTYRDFSNFPLSERPSGKNTNFPSKLHQILSLPDYSHIISWMPHGRAWKVHNKELLVQEVIPKYFLQSKYESFTRQLNGWGFKRLHQAGNDFNTFYHECFLSGLPHLVALMKRATPNKGKLIPNVQGEPNFYEIDNKFPLPRGAMPTGHRQYPYLGISGYGAPPGQLPSGYHSHPLDNYLSSYPGVYPPHPPPYGHLIGNAHSAAAAMTEYPLSPYYPPPEQYPHYPYPHGPPYDVAPPHYENDPLPYRTNTDSMSNNPF